MAVYTDVGDDDLRNFLADYDVGNVLAFKGIAEGVENSNFLLNTTKCSFILTLYEKRVATEDLPFFLNLMSHLANSGFACPTPIADKQGKRLKTLSGRSAALISFLDGVSFKKPQPIHCQSLGQIMADMHNKGKSFDMTRRNSLTVSDWRPLFKQSQAQANNVIEDLERLILKELDYLEQHWSDNLPTGVIHADLFPDNVFFIGDQASGVIDFYFACTDILAYDVAICLNAWCFEADNSFNTTKARQLLKGYLSNRKMSEDELTALPLLARGAALRFLLTRLYDWLNTPTDALVKPKDPREYYHKLKFHQTVTSAREYGIEI